MGTLSDLQLSRYAGWGTDFPVNRLALARTSASYWRGIVTQEGSNIRRRLDFSSWSWSREADRLGGVYGINVVGGRWLSFYFLTFVTLFLLALPFPSNDGDTVFALWESYLF